MKKFSLIISLFALCGSLSATVFASDDSTGFYALDKSGGVTYLGEEDVAEDFVLPSDGEVYEVESPQGKRRYMSKEEAEFRAKANLQPSATQAE